MTRSTAAVMRRKGHEASGFTMIEMLVTLTLFGLVLSSLVVGLHTGVSTWRIIRSNQSQEGALERAFEQIRLDAQHLFVIGEDNPPILETKEDFGGERLRLTVLGGRRAQQIGLGSTWAEVNYRVEPHGESESMSLVRETRAKVGPSEIDGAAGKEAILAGVDSVEFDYLGRDGTVVSVWGEEGSLPAGIQIVVHFESGRTVRRLVPVPVGYLQMAAGS